jgi:hypothetical protein
MAPYRGILRKRPAQYKPSEDRTVACLKYPARRLSDRGQWQRGKNRTHPGGGKDLYNNPQIYSNQPRTFKVHFSGNNVFYAAAVKRRKQPWIWNRRK